MAPEMHQDLSDSVQQAFSQQVGELSFTEHCSSLFLLEHPAATFENCSSLY